MTSSQLKLLDTKAQMNFAGSHALPGCCHMLLGELNTKCVNTLGEDNWTHTWFLLDLPDTWIATAWLLYVIYIFFL